MKGTRVLAGFAAASLSALLAACPPDPVGGDDAGEPSDASGADQVQLTDAATSDSATSDAGAIDSSGPDATVPDSAAGNAAGPDAGDPECQGRADYSPCATLNGSCLAGVCHEVGSCDDAICNTGGPSFVIPDTNQRVCYDDGVLMTCYSSPCNGDGSPDFCGQDAQYGWDITQQSSARYTRATSTADQPVVTDNVTGLVWQGCAAGLSGDACATGSAEDKSWAAAKTYCADLTWGGHSDWMLPDRYQLRSIADYGRYSPSIDVTAFPATPSAWFWSSSSYADSTYRAWFVKFDYGNVYYYDKNSTNHVRCVRAGPLVASDRFTRTVPVANQPVVADSVTGLIWQGCAAGQSGDACTGSVDANIWQQALAYCEGLSWGGHSDWRLPNVGELESLGDDRRSSPSIDVTAFPATPLYWWFWSSSSYASRPDFAWIVHFGSGDVLYNDKNDTYRVRCVRSGP